MKGTLMIPKIIHYCWFGDNPIPNELLKCIDSWKIHCPDFEIMQWNEHNFDVNYNTFTQQAFKYKKWAFISDVARLVALAEYGGIYLDTDMELIKPFGKLLELEAFISFGLGYLSAGTIAAKKGHPLFIEFLKTYDTLKLVSRNNKMLLIPNNKLLTRFMVSRGLSQNNHYQVIDSVTIFPEDFLCPIKLPDGTFEVTKNTFAIHHGGGSWQFFATPRMRNFKTFLYTFLPKSIAKKIYNAYFLYRKEGISEVIHKIKHR